MTLNTSKKAKKTEERELNRNAIYNYIRTHAQTSKKDIFYHLGLSLPTIQLHIQDLLSEGLIYEDVLLGNTGGRKAQTYSCNLNKKFSFGIEITSNHISVVVLNLLGEILDYIHIREPFSFTEPYLKKLGESVQKLKESVNAKDDQILGVGIVLPALVSDDHQLVTVGPILNITGATLEEFTRYIPYPGRLYNDANAACYAETWANPHMNNCFFMTVGSHIGGALLFNNEVYTGATSRSAEVGHMTFIPGGRPCYCGRKGCFDSYCSTLNLTSYSEGNLEEFFRHLRQGEEPFTSVWKEYLENLSVGVNNVRMLFDNEVIIGGYLGTYLDEYLDDLKKLAAERNTFQNDADYIHVCEFKYESFAAGAGLPFIDEFIKEI